MYLQRRVPPAGNTSCRQGSGPFPALRELPRPRPRPSEMEGLVLPELLVGKGWFRPLVFLVRFENGI